MILLDTHVLVWLSTEPAKLSKQASRAIRRASRSGGIAISAITLWELAWLARLIGATALAEGIALVTKDAKIRSCKQLSTIW